MINFTSIQFNPVNFSDAAVPGYNGNIFNKYRAVINFYWLKYTSTVKRLKFSSSGNTITNDNALDYDSFINTYNFQVGETIQCPQSSSNTGILTIISVTDRVITVSNTLTNEEVDTGYIYVTTKVTALDFFYNLIANSESNSYLSKTDIGTLQKYTISGLDASDTSTVHNLLVGTNSFGWVAEPITAPNTVTSTIVGAGISTYQQAFTLTHYFFQTPLFLKEQVDNFRKKTAPSEFQDNQLANQSPASNGLKYITQINVKYAQGTAYIDSGNSTNTFGTGSWFNMNSQRTQPEFIFNSILYQKASDSSIIEQLDFGYDVNVILKIKSNSGLFVNNTTPLVLGFFYCPLDDTTYINTPGSNLATNFMGDKAITHLGNTSVNGTNYGTPTQVLKSVIATYVDAYNATITFTVSLSSQFKANFLSKIATDRNYCINVTTETSSD